MSKKFQAVSYIQRIKDTSFAIKMKRTYTPINVYRSEQVTAESTGRIYKRYKLVPYDVAKQLSKYKVSDFCLENLHAIGLVSSLSPVSIAGDRYASINGISQALSNLNSKSE